MDGSKLEPDEKIDFNKLKAYKTLDWDYMGYKNYIKDLLCVYSVNDWCQTLITKINQMAAIIGEENLRGVGNQIYLNRRIETLLMKSPYYNISNGIISERYKVIIDDGIVDDKIYMLCSDKENNIDLNFVGVIEIKNYDDKLHYQKDYFF